MAYDEGLIQRIRELIGSHPTVKEKKMFGGVGFIARGNMACGVTGEDLIVRVGVENYQESLTKPHARPFDMTGRPMSGWIMVSPEGYADDADLERWVNQGLEFALTLPAK